MKPTRLVSRHVREVLAMDESESAADFELRVAQRLDQLAGEGWELAEPEEVESVISARAYLLVGESVVCAHCENEGGRRRGR